MGGAASRLLKLADNGHQQLSDRVVSKARPCPVNFEQREWATALLAVE